MFNWLNDAQKQVEKILANRNKQDDNAADLARSLVKLSRDLYGQEDRFIYELLQNANDSAKKNAPVNVTFEVLGGRWLVVSHDGNGFSEADVRGLTSVGLSSDKRENADAIGYKGIGFKSVFAVSDWVCIQSGNYRFRFDLSAWPSPSTTPWQILPLWTEPGDIPEIVRERLGARAERVAFAIRVRNDFNVAMCLTDLFKDPNILLFLTRVASVELALPAQTRFEREVSSGAISIRRDGKLVNRWLTRNFTFDVPTDLQEKLAQNEDYPEKLRNAKQASISLAASLGADGQPDGKTHPVYTFLPTDVNLELPIVINGNFILTASRQTAQNSDPWNAFLFQQAGSCFAKWLAELANTPAHRRNFTRLLPAATVHGGNARLHGIFMPVFEAAIKQVAFVPTSNGKQVKLDSAIWDALGVFSSLGETVMRRFDGLQNASLIDPDMERPDKLVRLGLTKIGTDELEAVLTACAPALTNPGANSKVIDALSKAIGQNTEAFALLKALCWVLDGQGALRAPKDLYLPPRDGLISEELQALGLSFYFLHPTLAAADSAVAWLDGLGVRPFSKKDFLRGSVLPAIADGRVTEGNTITIGRFVFECSGALGSDDLVTLRKMPLRVKGGGLKPATSTWLASEYEPDEPLEALLGDTAGFSFVDPSYMRTGETTSDWRVFLKQIGVSNAIAISYLDNLDRTTLQNEGESIRAYLSFLDDGCYDAIYRSYRSQHVVNHFPYTAVVNYLSTPAIARLFWAAVVPAWSKTLFESDYLVNRRTHTVKVPSFVRYLLEHQPIVPTTEGICRPASEVYHRSPRLETLIGSAFPLTDFGDVSLTAQQAKEIGLRTDLSLKDALTLLDRVAGEPWSDAQLSRLNEIYTWFGRHTLTEVGQQIVRDWRLQARFLAQDGSFRPANELCLVFSDKRLNAEAPERFLKFNGKPTSFATTAEFFDLAGVRVIRDEELTVDLVGAEEQLAPRQAVLERSPLLALIRKDLTEALLDAVARLNTAIVQTSFIQCEGCKFRAGDEVRFDLADEAWVANGSLYFRGDWQSPLTRYSLMSPLCEMLGLNGNERKVELILSLSVSDGLAWLETQGLDVTPVRAMTSSHVVEATLPAAESEPTETIDDAPDANEGELAGFDVWNPELDWADVHVACAENDFSLTRSDKETEAFAQMLVHMLAGNRSTWGGWIYHVTHLENALAILADGTLLPRASVAHTSFKDAAGQHLIHRTTDDVKEFARFYFRPLTPTQWHNECLGRRQGDIHALCPVPVFFRVNLEDVLRANGAACAVSNGNLAASASRYGNSASFLEFFDDANVYSKFGQVELQTYFRACQQEFLVHGGLALSGIRFEMVCRNEQDRVALVNQLTPGHGVTPDLVRVDPTQFFNDNPAVQLLRTADGLEVKMTGGSQSQGTMSVRVSQYDARDRQIISTAGRIATFRAGDDLVVQAGGDVLVPGYEGQALDVIYREKNTEWVIFKGPF